VKEVGQEGVREANSEILRFLQVWLAIPAHHVTNTITADF
jgi:hypothetical protein